MGVAIHKCVKLPRLHLSKFDLHSLAVQTALELALGAVLTALLLRWFER
jgi:hypothetical protein